MLLNRPGQWCYLQPCGGHAPDAFKALEDLIDSGCGRVLTSGRKTAAPDAADLLKQLVEQAGNRIIVVPAPLLNLPILQSSELQAARTSSLSARKIAPNPVTYLDKEVNDYGNVYIADEIEVKAMIDALNKLAICSVMKAKK